MSESIIFVLNEAYYFLLNSHTSTICPHTCLTQVAPQAQVVPQKVMSPLVDSALLSFWES